MAMPQAGQILGNLYYWETHRQRIIEAWGSGVCKFLEEFVGTPFEAADTPGGWTVTLVESGGGGETTVVLTGAAGGQLLITTDNAENDGANLQVKGEAFKLEANKPCYFGTRLKISDATESDLLVGLCITDTDLLGGMTDGVYFRKVDGATTLALVLEKDSTETSGNVATVANDTWMILEFFWNGTNLDAYVDGVPQTRPVLTNLPNDEELTPSIHFLTGTTAVKTCAVDWVRCVQFNS